MRLGGVRMLAVYLVAATMLVVLTYRQFGEPWWREWLMFYVASVLWPSIWTFRALRRQEGQPVDAAARAFAWGPVIVGATSLATALTLLDRALGR